MSASITSIQSYLNDAKMALAAYGDTMAGESGAVELQALVKALKKATKHANELLKEDADIYGNIDTVR